MLIGNLTISDRVLLAPMAGVTDVVFRRMCRHFGAAIVYSEFLSSDGLVLDPMNQHHKLVLADDEHPVAYQLFGAKTELFASAAQALEKNGPDLIDLNFGCPVKKVIKGNAGAAILRDLDLLYSIVHSVVDSVSIPVTVKMRAGWDADNLVFNEAAECAVKAGAQAVTLHARTRSDGNWGLQYSGGARWEWIAELKKTIRSVPIIGNGDVDSPDSAVAMFEQTGCDAVMVGRGAIGRPWIFAEINHLLDTGNRLPEPSVADRLAVALENLRRKVSLSNNERGAVIRTRRQLAAYVKGLPRSGWLRSRLMSLESVHDIREMFAVYLSSSPDLPRCDGDEWLSDYMSFDRAWFPSTSTTVSTV